MIHHKEVGGGHGHGDRICPRGFRHHCLLNSSCFGAFCAGREGGENEWIVHKGGLVDLNQIEHAILVVRLSRRWKVRKAARNSRFLGAKLAYPVGTLMGKRWDTIALEFMILTVELLKLGAVVVGIDGNQAGCRASPRRAGHMSRCT